MCVVRMVNQIKLIESVQRKFTKGLPGYASLSDRDRLSRLGLNSLELRRLRYDLLLTYKIVIGLTDEAANNMFTLTSSLHSVIIRGHANQLNPHNCRIDIRKYFFSKRVVAPWNNLPATNEHFCSLSFLKRPINSTDFSTLNEQTIDRPTKFVDQLVNQSKSFHMISFIVTVHAVH